MDTRRLIAAALAGILAATPIASAQIAVESCPETSDPSTWAGATMDTGTTKDGTVYSTSYGGSLALQKTAGIFKSTPLATTDPTVYAAVGDFDKDGWPDFVGAGEATAFLRVYKNRTYNNPAPDWTNPNAIRTPSFASVRELINPSSPSPAPSGNRIRPTIAADFNGDGWDDILHISSDWYSRPSYARLWLNRASNDASGNPRFTTPTGDAMTPSQLGYMNWGGNNLIAYDYNGDRKLDLLVGSSESNGSIRVFLNQCTLQNPQPTPVPAAPRPLKCSNTPTFTFSSTLISGIGSGWSSSTEGALPVFAYGLIDNDSYPDLVVGAPRLGTLRMFRGKAGNALDTANPQSISFVGAATGVLAADFSQDGRLDLIVTCDNWNYPSDDVLGGTAVYYVNNGTNTPFSSGPKQTLTSHWNPSQDYDVSLFFDYDGDPAHTIDALVADGNHTNQFYVLANRVVDQYVDCGTAASGVIDLGDLADEEMVVTAARIHPTATLNGGTIAYYLSNEEPPNWVQATACGDSSGDLCAIFPKSSGRDVRWKAVMCSNASHTATPYLAGIEATFDFARAREHYRAGVVAHEGVTYVGGFREPGDRGKFYAINTGLSQTYWDGAAKLDAMGDATRNLYTMHRSTWARLDFEKSGTSVSSGLIATMTAADATQAAAVIDWVRGPRFGTGNTGIALSRLGAIETSTPAVLTAPALPSWYAYATGSQRETLRQFVTNHADRRSLVLFGSKDGMIHALHSRPDDITASVNGTEAWGFIPPEVAAGFVGDYSNSLGGATKVTAYPDGSPTLADVVDDDGEVRTVAMVAAGNGGRSVVALDVTESVDDESGAVLGPTPLWSVVPGDSAAGQAYSKVTVARVEIGDEPRFVAIAGTGPAFDDLTPPYESGRTVVAYDAVTGEALWRFQTRCPLTSDLTSYETNDDLEPGEPEFDGFMDRVVFADRCGYVYKVDPARDLDGGWNGNAGMGAIAVDEVGGVQMYALFSTAETAGALGAESPIAGTLGAQDEGSTGRKVLFFGTGGLESHPVDQPNEFYAVYADDGSIHTKLAGACDDGRCEKFYGGVVVSSTQVLFTRTEDPTVGTGACDRGSSVIEGVELSSLGEDGGFIRNFSTSVGSAVMGSLFGADGAIYFATLGGDVVRIGQPSVTEAGGDDGDGEGGSGGSDSSYDPDRPMTLMGWRQVF